MTAPDLLEAARALAEAGALWAQRTPEEKSMFLAQLVGEPCGGTGEGKP